MSASGALESGRAVERTGVFPWWLVLIEGVAALIVGILLLLAPQATLELIIQIFGLFWLVDGVLRIASACTDPSDRGLKLFMGSIGVLAGIAVVRHPLWLAVTMTTMLVLLLGGVGAVIGAISLFLAFRGRGWGAAVVGVLSLLFALFVLANPFMNNPEWVYLYATLSLAGGLVALVMAFRMHKALTLAASPVQPVSAGRPAHPEGT
jgi:uncharacterized membrane protein HdeD (DUF308 family)